MKLNTKISMSAGNDADLPLLGKVAAAAVLMMASTGAFALNTGTDLNLSAKPASGGMAGASYTKPQEPSAAVFGNPAALTQFSGTRFGIGAVYLSPKIEVTQTSGSPNGLALLDGTGPRTSRSGAVDYVGPDVAVSHELGGGWFIGGGLEVDAGAGVDFRNDPITVPTGSSNPLLTGLPLVVELLSFNANLAVAKKLTPQTSVGGALTLGFGLAQLGTVGPSGSFPSPPVSFSDLAFGGTTASVHDFSAGASVGITHQLTPTLMVSAALKSPIEYGFNDILYTGGGPFIADAGFQQLKVEQPLELVAGAAFDITSSWLVEADLVWKNWSQATTYQDVFKDQFLLLLGTQYKTGPWSLRAGYSYAEDIMRETPNNTLGGVRGLGPVPLGDASGPIGVELVKLVQTTLVPVVWNHTISAGVGFDISPIVRLDAFGAYAIKGDVTRQTSIGAILTSANAPPDPVITAPEIYRGEASAWAIGAGLNFKF